MEELGHPGFLKTYGETRAWLNACITTEGGACRIYPDTLEVDVINITDRLTINTRLSNLDKYILVKFRNVAGDFILYHNHKLLTLKGFPVDVTGHVEITRCSSLLTFQYALCRSNIFSQDLNTGLISSATNIVYDTCSISLRSGWLSEDDSIKRRNSKEKADRFIDWMVMVSKDEYIDCLSWLNEYDLDTYEEILPHLIPKCIELGYDLGLSEDVTKISNVALATNHRI